MPQSLRLRSAGARAEEERKNFTDYFSRILASICGICVLSEEKLRYGQRAFGLTFARKKLISTAKS
jgi:hypothetical protein